MFSPRWACSLLIGLFLAERGAFAQTPPRDLRSVEIAVEIAWMADPITFPYELRAITHGGVLEVHGAVPDAFVRKQALNIARLHSRSKALDQTDITAAAAKNFTPVPANQVVARTQAALARAMPQLTSSVNAQCDADGVVTLSGSASTVAEKVACGELMRRIPGCLRVQNTIEVGGKAPVSQPPAQTAVSTVPVIEPDRPTTNAVTEQIRLRVAQVCPQASDLAVYQTAPGRYQIQFTAANDAAATALARTIFNQPDLQRLRIDINANVPQ